MTSVAHLTQFDFKRSMRAVRAMFSARGHKVSVRRIPLGDMSIRGRTNIGGSIGFDPSDVTITGTLREFGILRADETLKAMDVSATPDQVLVPEDLVHLVRSIT